MSRIKATEQVVLAHGTFDLLHPGHLAYLEFAKRQGDYLVVAIAGDEITRVRKGKTRPIQSSTDRAKIVAALSVVDKVIETRMPSKDLFTNIVATAKELQPAKIVTSYNGLVDAYGDALAKMDIKVVIAPVFEGGTTTKLIERIIERHENKA